MGREMKRRPNDTAIKRTNQAHTSKATSRIPMSTSYMSTPQERIDIRIPKKSKIYEYLYVDNAPEDCAMWKRLDRLLVVASQKEHDLILSAWEDFVRRVSFFHPEKRQRLDQLRALIYRKIILGEELSEEYWEEIRKP